ncbi:MAG: single-stranded DNA-binding protein [Methylocella sp.]
MICALVGGVLFKNPEPRKSRLGREFVAATLKIQSGKGLAFVKIVAFERSACDELLRLKAGDAVSIQGMLEAGVYTPDGGEARVSLSIVADRVLACRQPPRERKPKASGDAARGGAAAFDDSIPFGAP